MWPQCFVCTLFVLEMLGTPAVIQVPGKDARIVKTLSDPVSRIGFSPARSIEHALLPTLPWTTALSAAVALHARHARRNKRHLSACRSSAAKEQQAQDQEDQADQVDQADQDEIDKDQEYYEEIFPPVERLEKIGEDGQKYVCVKYGAVPTWVPDSDVGTYRFSQRGYESRDPDGKWVCHAQMPPDTSHLTDAQRERLVLELRGQISFNLSDGVDEEGFKPLPQVPPLEKWPFYRVDITDESKISEEQQKDYQVLELTEDIGRAFFLATRWKVVNEGRRALGYGVNTSINDVAYMNGVVLGYKALVNQIKRISRFRRRKEEDQVPSDADRLQKLQCTSLLGTAKGSGIALWFYNESRKKLMIDLCLGDDCIDQGPYAEEMVLRYLVSKGEKLGAETIWCRSRRTESGKVFLPQPMRNLGFSAVPIEEQEEEEWETLGIKQKEEEATEAVPGLRVWLATRDLESFLPDANAWCDEMGATDINEVAENKYDLADFLEEKGLSSEQRLKLVQF